MALDLNHGIYVRRGGVNYFYSSYTHAVSPAIAFRVGGVTRYCPLVSGGGYLKVRRSGTTYGISGGSATVTVTCTFSNLLGQWTGCSYSIGNNGFAVASTIVVQVQMQLVSPSRTFNVSANQTSGSETISIMGGGGKKTITVTVTAFGKTYTGSASATAGATSATCSVTVS